MNKPYYSSKKKRKGGGYVYTLSKGLIKELNDSHPHAVSFFLYLLQKEIYRHCHTQSKINGLQYMDLNTIFLPILESHKQTIETRFIELWFRDGVRFMDADMWTILENLNRFYQMLYPYKNGKYE